MQRTVKALGAEAVIIGAMAYRQYLDASHFTSDIDLAIALDFDEFKILEEALGQIKWKQDPHQEQRWITPHENRFDLVPAGPHLRKAGKVVWPRSGFVMSLGGFGHVFQDAPSQDIGQKLKYKVVPPPVLALLKMTAYLDDPERRSKDLLDLRNLMRRYEQQSDRMFSDVVFQADLPDIEFAGAFLLGLDLRAIGTEEDRILVTRFVKAINQTNDLRLEKSYIDEDSAERSLKYFRQQLNAFAKSFTKAE